MFVALVFAWAALFGGMLMFSVLFAPLVFVKLPAEHAAKFIRSVFPWYYLWVLVFSALTALGFAVLQGVKSWTFLVAGAIALTAAFLRFVLLAKINALRDAQLAGDKAAGKRFDFAHRFSVIVNILQLLLAAGLVAAIVK